MKKKKRIVFVGCVKEGRECLEEILNQDGVVVAIITFTDKIAQKTAGAVSFQHISDRYGIPLYKVRSTNTPEATALVKKINPNLIFVIGWTRLVSPEIISIPEYGCFGMHASILPKYRGRAPVNWAIINNEKETGNSLILLNEGVDTGKVVLQKKFPITLADTCETVYEKVSHSGRTMIREVWPMLGHSLQVRAQDENDATVMPKRAPEDGIIDWNMPALGLFNWVRALTHPYPGAFTYFGNKKLFVWEARIVHNYQHERNAESKNPGTVISTVDGIIVATGDKEMLSLHSLSLEDGDEMKWSDFVISNSLSKGMRLG